MKTALYVGLALTAFCLATFAAGPIVSEPIVPADPDAAGRELAAQLRSLQPVRGMTNNATLNVFAKKTRLLHEIPMQIIVEPGENGWTTSYVLNPEKDVSQTRLRIIRDNGGKTKYNLSLAEGESIKETAPCGADLMTPFGGSEFWLADLGMEFLQWPVQRLLKKELCRGQSCDKLESLAPPGQTNGYVRVVAWFDIDTGGPVLVEAYNAAGKMVKEFKPNDFKKVDGEWQVEEVEIYNPRTKARSTIRFDLSGQ